MQSFPIIITAPVAPDKKLQASYQQLTSDAGAAAEKRAATDARCTDLARRKQAARPDEAAAIQVELMAIEIEQIERELPILRRVPDYLQAALTLRKREVEVAHQMIPLAEAQVRAVFDRDFDPARWSARPGALGHFIANHPIVLGAHDRLAEVDRRQERDALSAAQLALQDAEKRLAQLTGSIEGAKREAAQEKSAAQARAAREAEARAEQDRNSAAIEAARKKAADEARKRLGV